MFQYVDVKKPPTVVSVVQGQLEVGCFLKLALSKSLHERRPLFVLGTWGYKPQLTADGSS